MDRIGRAVAQQMKPVLEGHGFDFRSSWNGFVRDTEYGSEAFLVVNQGTTMGMGRFFEMKCYPAVRHEVIEVPWNTFGFVWGEEAQRQTATLTYTHPRGNLPVIKVAPSSLKTDVEAAAQEMSRVFKERALPFFGKFSELSAVEEFVNRQPLAELYPYNAGGPLDHLAARSLLLAKASNKNRYRAVRDACLASTKKTLWPRERYLQTIEHIDSLAIG